MNRVIVKGMSSFYPGMLIANYSPSGDIRGYWRVKKVLAGNVIGIVKQRWYHCLVDRVLQRWSLHRIRHARRKARTMPRLNPEHFTVIE